MSVSSSKENIGTPTILHLTCPVRIEGDSAKLPIFLIICQPFDCFYCWMRVKGRDSVSGESPETIDL